MLDSFITTDSKNDKAIGLWLGFVALLVMIMVVVGGITRLTESGLSIVSWQPISGTLPPMNVEDWQAEFTAYKATPEYQQVNRGMSLDEFKGIFWWEFSHRLLGRFIGLAFAIPLLFFMARRMVRPELKMTLFGLLALGGMQGVMGWYMVMSGLVNEPAVSHYRLAAHLGLALAIIVALTWVALGLLRPLSDDVGRKQFRGRGIMARPFQIILGLVFLQCLLGALVAGLDAGHVYGTWPLMGQGFVPPDLLAHSPAWINFLENPSAVQFDHRILAYIITAYVLWVWFWGRAVAGRPLDVLFALILLQVSLGIFTLLSGVHIPIAAAHQGVAVLVLVSATYLLYESHKKE